jgi:hypothetical protein
MSLATRLRAWLTRRRQDHFVKWIHCNHVVFLPAPHPSTRRPSVECAGKVRVS